MCNTDETSEESFALIGPHKSKSINTWEPERYSFPVLLVPVPNGKKKLHSSEKVKV